MKTNPYTNRMDQIKAPQDAVDRAVKAALEADSDQQKENGKVIRMDAVMNNSRQTRRTGKSRRMIRVVSAVAACAVLAAGVTVASVMTGNNGKGAVHNGFSLTANAAALKKGSTIDILSIKASEPSGTWSMESDGVTGSAVMEEYLTFTVDCKGENIKSVNYRVHNGVFCLGSWQTVMEEGSEKCTKYRFSTAGDQAETVPASKENMNQPDDQQPSAVDTGSNVELSWNNLYTAYTVPYDKQNMLSSYAADMASASFYDPDGIAIKTDYPSCAIATCLSTNDKELSQDVKNAVFHYNKSVIDDVEGKSAYAEYVMGEYDKARQNGHEEPSGLMEYEEFEAKNYSSTFDKDKDFKIVYDEMINDITIDVTVTYNDGATETSTMKLSCEKVENGIVTVGAELV